MAWCEGGDLPLERVMCLSRSLRLVESWATLVGFVRGDGTFRREGMVVKKGNEGKSDGRFELSKQMLIPLSDLMHGEFSCSLALIQLAYDIWHLAQMHVILDEGSQWMRDRVAVGISLRTSGMERKPRWHSIVLCHA